MLSMKSRNEVIEETIIKTNYHKLNKAEKGKVLDLLVDAVSLDRKRVVKKIKLSGQEKGPKYRAKKYGVLVKKTLEHLWELFDYQNSSSLKENILANILTIQKELNLDNDITNKLKEISPKTIDNLLKDVRKNKRHRFKYQYIKNEKNLQNQVPIKSFDELNRDKPGYLQIDTVEHGGASASGHYGYTLSITDCFSQWHENYCVLGRGQDGIFKGLKICLNELPFLALGAHPDNGTEILNWQIFRYMKAHNIEYTRSKPNKKNHNCLVEQKNFTNVRKVVGYQRYDTDLEINLINELYRNELRLWQNFFVPHTKLISKIRIDGHVKRQYAKPKTAAQYLLESEFVNSKSKEQLQYLADNLNPFELKKIINKKIDDLIKIYRKKNNSEMVDMMKKLRPTSVSFLRGKKTTISVS